MGLHNLSGVQTCKAVFMSFFFFILSERELAVVHSHVVDLTTPFKSLGGIKKCYPARLSAKGGIRKEAVLASGPAFTELAKEDSCLFGVQGQSWYPFIKFHLL